MNQWNRREAYNGLHMWLETLSLFIIPPCTVLFLSMDFQHQTVEMGEINDSLLFLPPSSNPCLNSLNSCQLPLFLWVFALSLLLYRIVQKSLGKQRNSHSLLNVCLLDVCRLDSYVIMLFMFVYYIATRLL